MSPVGTKRTSDDVRSESAFGRKAEVGLRAIRAALDPQQTFRSAFVWFRNMRGGLLSVSIRGGRPKSEPPAVWMNFAREPCPTWDVGKAMQLLGRKLL